MNLKPRGNKQQEKSTMYPFSYPESMPYSNSSDLLARCLEGEYPTAKDLDAIIFWKEDQYLDFKQWSQNDKERKDTIRKWVAGFANTEGGVLLMGVRGRDSNGHATGDSADTPKITGCAPVGSESLESWADGVLSEFTGKLIPWPRINVISHGEGDVLLIATSRAPQVIQRVKNGRLYIDARTGQCTHELPDALAVDLLLGRRNHPIIEVVDVNASIIDQNGLDQQRIIHVAIEVRNRSFQTAEGIVGTVAWSLADESANLDELLLGYVRADTAPGQAREGKVWTLNHEAQNSYSLRPFANRRYLIRIASVSTDDRIHSLSFAFYFSPEGSPPTWFEITIAQFQKAWLSKDKNVPPSNISVKRNGASGARVAFN